MMNNKAWLDTKAPKSSQQPFYTSLVASWPGMRSGLETLVDSIAPISLREMDAVALLNRMETKFVMSTDQMMVALAALSREFRVLCVRGLRLNHYRSLYFDTPDFALFNLHVNDLAERYKVRSREYTDSHLSFLEVKHKTRKNRTKKERISTERPLVSITPDARCWLSSVLPYDGQLLEPKIWNTFTRITLVSKRECERVTLDVDLAFYTADKIVRLDGIAIAEIKTEAQHKASPFLAQMRAMRIQPQGFSKYCIGVSMMYDHVKRNAMKSKMMWIDRMFGGVQYE